MRPAPPISSDATVPQPETATGAGTSGRGTGRAAQPLARWTHGTTVGVVVTLCVVGVGVVGVVVVVAPVMPGPGGGASRDGAVDPDVATDGDDVLVGTWPVGLSVDGIADDWGTAGALVGANKSPMVVPPLPPESGPPRTNSTPVTAIMPTAKTTRAARATRRQFGGRRGVDGADTIRRGSTSVRSSSTIRRVDGSGTGDAGPGAVRRVSRTVGAEPDTGVNATVGS